MDTVHVFDIASLQNSKTPDGVWYAQNTSGQAPAPRMHHCLIAVSAPDNSSHNIYLYGGTDGAGTYFDEVWILSLPSFQWTKVFQGNSPRYGMSCHLVGNSQMLTVGGADSINLYDNCDWEIKGVAILNVSSIIWGSVFEANGADYRVPDQVVSLVGGS